MEMNNYLNFKNETNICHNQIFVIYYYNSYNKNFFNKNVLEIIGFIKKLNLILKLRWKNKRAENKFIFF